MQKEKLNIKTRQGAGYGNVQVSMHDSLMGHPRLVIFNPTKSYETINKSTEASGQASGGV